MSALVLERKNLGTLNSVSCSLTRWQAAGRSCWAGGAWRLRHQGQFCSSQAGSELLHLFSTCLNSCPNQLTAPCVPLQHVGFPHRGVLPHSLFCSCNKSYKSVYQPKPQKRRTTLIKLLCKALNQISFSVNSSICFDFILRKEQYLQPGVVNSFMHFLMKQDTPTSCSTLISLPRAKIFLNREWLSSGRKTHWEDKVCVPETWISFNSLFLKMNSVLYAEAGVSNE